MIKIEKDKYLKVNENCYICNLRISDQGPTTHMYAVAINTCTKYLEFSGYEIYGFGATIETALIMAMGHLTHAALKGIAIQCLKEMSIDEFIKTVAKEEGLIAQTQVEVIYTRENGEKNHVSVWIEDENCCPFFT